MKKYIGTKMIEAERAFRIGDRIYSNENDEINAVLLAEGQIAVMGYKVRYADGYESFSPKGVFEKAYLPLEENKNLKTDAPSISAQMVEDFIDEVFVSTAGEKTTVVRAVLVNGFEILESSSCWRAACAALCVFCAICFKRMVSSPLQDSGKESVIGLTDMAILL